MHIVFAGFAWTTEKSDEVKDRYIVEDQLNSGTLAGKHVLLIMPKFFGYDKEVKMNLINQGASVSLIYENMGEVNIAYKFIFAFLKLLRQKVINRYYRKRISEAEHKFDYVLVIRGSTMTDEVLSMIKDRAAENCRFIMYQWDSVENNRAVLPYVHHFDMVGTFDIKDAEKYNWRYLPLFFVDRLTVQNMNRSIDLSFVCTMHSQRFQIYKKLKELTEKKKWVFYHHVYMQRLFYMKYKYLDKNPIVSGTKRKDLSFRSMSLRETYMLYQRSKIVVDYTHPGQTGFTMRTIEAMGNGCKLITNNPLIKQADFYNPNNILVYEGTDVEIPDWFVQSPYEEPEEKIYRKYALTEWLKDILTQ